nr:unnamed protein product [Callosobruchus chinensis]
MHFPVFCNKLAVWVPHCAGIVKLLLSFSGMFLQPRIYCSL